WGVPAIVVDGLEVAHGSLGAYRPFSETVIQAKILANQERLVVNGAQYREHADRNPTEQRRYDAGLRSLLMVPLVWQGRSIGSLNVRSTNPNAYGEHEIELAEQISAQIAGAIATSAQYTLIEAESSERQRLAEEQSVIAQIGRIASSSLDTNEVFTTFSEQAQKLIPFDRFVVSVISEDRSELIDEFVYGIKFDDSLEGLHIPVSQIFEYQHLFVNKLPLNLSGDELSNLKDSPEEKIRISFGFKALLVVPLEWHDQVIGLITFRALDPDAFGEHEVEVAVQISAQIAGAIATTNQYRLLRAALADVELNAAALEAADDAIIIRNADSSVAYVNSGFERQTGFSRDEVVGTDFMYPEHDDSGSDGLENLWDQLRRGESWRKIVPSTRKDGTEYIVDASLTPIFNESGEIDKFLGVRRDVTAMVRADESIRLQAAALEAADDAIVLVNSETAIEWVNEAFVRDTGYTREEAIGQKSPFLRSDKVPDQLFDDMWASVGDGKTWHSRLWVRRKDGTDYPVEGSVTPVFDDDGNVAHYIGIRRDITELLQAEKDREATRDLDAQNKQLLELNEQREEFFSTVSHELRTPLTSVMAFADILSRDRDGTLTNRQQEHLNVIKRNSRNLNSLVEDMLDFSRMTTDQLRLEKSEFEIHSLLDSVVESLEPTAHQRDQALWIEPHTEPIWVTADHSRVVQILSNLITNSCKYSPASTRITVAVGYEPGFLSMVVTDQGIGIPPEVIENIYSPFFRSGQHEVREEVGTGLGLAISKTLVDLHNGTISAESVVNQGTTITVTLPGASPTPTVNAKT
ncbi:MAG: PAS domain S-box protein, partial [Chloroflexi bacterium]|nr:PAS domain S-box protein [Chloroflexota bacterium]